MYIQVYFCAVYGFVKKKVVLRKDYWDPIRLYCFLLVGLHSPCQVLVEVII